jgi:hypothetical protein
MNNYENNNSGEEDRERLVSNLVAVKRLASDIEMADDETLTSIQEGSKKRDVNSYPPVERAVLKGIHQAIEIELRIRRAWKNSKGKWYAIASEVVWKSHRHLESIGDEIDVVECNGRSKAIETARNLYKKHAKLFDDLTYIEVEIMPAIAYWKYGRGIKR